MEVIIKRSFSTSPKIKRYCFIPGISYWHNLGVAFPYFITYFDHRNQAIPPRAVPYGLDSYLPVAGINASIESINCCHNYLHSQLIPAL
jgi:hypothetical protein